MNKEPQESLAYLKERVSHLEKLNRFTIDALEMAASLGDFQASINQQHEPSAILRETRERIERLISLRATAFFLVDESENDFAFADCEPASEGEFIRKEIDKQIEKGTFAWSMRERRSVIVPTENEDKKLVLHVMATSSRVRGMFVGLLDESDSAIDDILLTLLSIILLNSSNALESFELYRVIREIRDNLAKKENYRMLFEAAPDGVEVLDAQGNIIDCNETQTRQLGCVSEQIIGKPTFSFLSDVRRKDFQKSRQLLKTEGYIEGEAILVGKNKTESTIWRKEKALYGENDEFIGSIVYNHDLTELKRTQEDKVALQAQLQRAEKMEAIGTLAGGVAHDLNNVLAGIVSYPEVVLLKLAPESSLRKPIRTIQRSGLKAAAIVQDLLTLARRGVATTEVVNLNHIIGEYLMSPEYEKLTDFHKKINIETHLNRDLLNIMGSPVHLSKTVMNLISNAAEAMPKGGIITISTQNTYVDHSISSYDDVKEGDYTTVTVTDNGIGIAPKDLEKIFEPFYTKKVMGRSGTGLGMAVVWGTVKDHHGYIDVKSDEGLGSSFTLYFPITRHQATRTTPIRSMDEYKGKGESILVVDDVAEQREIALSLLKQLGYCVTCVASGEEAVRFMKKNEADLVVLDMIMDPGIDGLETYRRILTLSSDQRAIITSGFTETERVSEAQRLGAGPYIRKPYLMERLGVAVRSELDRQV
jgi:PAS domain S-box-containing protein